MASCSRVPVPGPERQVKTVHVDLYDTTLRDGTQQEGISPTVADKLRVASVVDTLGVRYIEGGWPGANPKDSEFFRRAADGELTLERAQLTAFGMTRRPRGSADSDPVLAALLDARTSVVCMVGKASASHVRDALGVTLDEGIAMVADSVRFLVAQGRRVFFDAEHFFDGHAEDPGFALAVLDVAADAGAACVVLCDTNGGALPDQVRGVVTEAVARMGERAQVGIHVHNDTDCAVANTLVAVQAGATHVQGTVNGIGERCGNADLISVLANLKLKLGMEVCSNDDLQRLTGVAHGVAEVLNLTPDPHAPYVGSAAFAHKAGLHVSALAKRTDFYQHVEPERVGNSLRLLVSELAGRATVVMKGAGFGLDLAERPEVVDRVLSRVKSLEHAGYAFEAADASFELLVREEGGEQPVAFTLESFRSIVERREDGQVVAEATVKVWVGEERLIGAGEGNGPVDALDAAFRAAVSGHFPHLAKLSLADYKVRILDANAGTAATTRVLLTSSDGERDFTTVGVSSNVIEASWRAMADAYAYALAADAG